MIPACSVCPMYMALMCTVVRAGNLWALIILSASISACVVSKVTHERGASKEGGKEDQVLVQFRFNKDAPSFTSTAAGGQKARGSVPLSLFH